MCFLASRNAVPFSPEVTPFAPTGGPTTFVYGSYLDEVWSMMESDEAEIYSHFYFLSGVNYSVMGVIDAYNGGNTLAEAYEYDPYGRHRVIGPGTDATYFTGDDTFDEMHAGSINNSIRYTGQRFDAESNLMYYKNRYYDPAAGRFIGRDPLGWSEGPNRYGYVGGMPTMAVDPKGLCRIEVRYNKLGSIFGLSWYHAYVVVTDLDGSQTFFRGGPEGGGPGGSSGSTTGAGGGATGDSSGSDSSGSNSANSSSPGSGNGGDGAKLGPWGAIKTVSGAYEPSTIDWNPDSPPSVILMDNDRPCDCYIESLQEALDKIKEARIPYNPIGDNSNATAHEIVEDMGFLRPKPPRGVWAPGHKNRLTPEFPPPPTDPYLDYGDDIFGDY